MHSCVEIIGILDVNVVPAFQVDVQARSGNALVNRLGMKDGHQRVPRTMQNKGGATHLDQPVGALPVLTAN